MIDRAIVEWEDKKKNNLFLIVMKLKAFLMTKKMRKKTKEKEGKELVKLKMIWQGERGEID